MEVFPSTLKDVLLLMIVNALLRMFGPSHKRVRENLCVVVRVLTTEALFLLIHRSYKRVLRESMF